MIIGIMFRFKRNIRRKSVVAHDNFSVYNAKHTKYNKVQLNMTKYNKIGKKIIDY